MVAWVEARAASSPAHLIDDASRAKLQHALQVDPSHQRALWLLGISDFQRKDYAGATTQWKTLLPLLQPGSKVAATVQQELVEAQARAGGTQDTMPPPANSVPASPSTATTATADQNVALEITVKLDPKLAGRMSPGDTVFVFARALDGPPMPLAVARLKASALPATVTLTDAMAMTPKLRLSNYARVKVAAHTSRTGDAMPRAGDLESAPVEVASDSHTPVVLTIDKVD